MPLDFLYVSTPKETHNQCLGVWRKQVDPITSQLVDPITSKLWPFQTLPYWVLVIYVLTHCIIRSFHTLLFLQILLRWILYPHHLQHAHEQICPPEFNCALSFGMLHQFFIDHVLSTQVSTYPSLDNAVTISNYVFILSMRAHRSHKTPLKN